MTAIEFNYAICNTSRVLKSFAMKLTRDVDDANDLLQDTLVKAFLNREKYLDGTNLKAWLYTIMKNTFITNYQRMIRKNTFIDNSENLHYLNSSSVSIENGAYSEFAMEDINRAVKALDTVYSDPFMMYFNGYKYHEISDKLEIPIGTVKNRIHIARKELKDRLKIYENTLD